MIEDLRHIIQHGRIALLQHANENMQVTTAPTSDGLTSGPKYRGISRPAWVTLMHSAYDEVEARAKRLVESIITQMDTASVLSRLEFVEDVELAERLLEHYWSPLEELILASTKLDPITEVPHCKFLGFDAYDEVCGSLIKASQQQLGRFKAEVVRKVNNNGLFQTIGDAQCFAQCYREEAPIHNLEPLIDIFDVEYISLRQVSLNSSNRSVLNH